MENLFPMPFNLSTDYSDWVCGDFGHQALAPHGRQLATVNAVFTLLAICFGICGCASYSNNASAMKNVPWVVAAQKDGASVNFGIRAYSTYDKDGNVDTNGAVAFDSETCTKNPLAVEDANYCKKCDDASVATVATGSIAIICAFGALAFEIMRRQCDHAFNKDMSLISGVAAFVFGCVSYVRAQPCYNAIVAYAKAANVVLTASKLPVYVVTYGTGAKLMAGAFAVMLLLTIMTLMVPVEKNKESAVPQGEVSKV